MILLCEECGFREPGAGSSLCNYCEAAEMKKAAKSTKEIKRKQKAKDWIQMQRPKVIEMYSPLSQKSEELNSKKGAFSQDFLVVCMFGGVIFLLQRHQEIAVKIAWLFNFSLERVYLIGLGWLLGLVLLAVYLFTAETIPRWIKISTIASLAPTLFMAALFLP